MVVIVLPNVGMLTKNIKASEVRYYDLGIFILCTNNIVFGSFVQLIAIIVLSIVDAIKSDEKLK